MAIGQNQPLVQEQEEWTSEVPLTEGQLRGKRDTFWETAPAYEGRKEIWDALRAACEAVEEGDFVLAQAIVDGVNLCLPRGVLEEVISSWCLYTIIIKRLRTFTKPYRPPFEIHMQNKLRYVANGVKLCTEKYVGLKSRVQLAKNT